MSICNICLRPKLNLRPLDDYNVKQFYEELCNYGNRTKCKFCPDCFKKLKKCYEFKKCCRHAIDILKTWAKQPKADRNPKELLYTTMPEPAPHLSLCNKKNFKVYAYQKVDAPLHHDNAIEIPCSTHPHIVTINIPDDDNIEQPFYELAVNVDEKVIENVLVKEQDIKVEFMNLADSESHSLDMGDIFTDEPITKPIKSEHKPIPIVIQMPDDELGSLASDFDASDSDVDKILVKKAPLSDSEEPQDSDSDESLKELESILASLEKQQQSKQSLTKEVTDDPNVIKLKKKPINVEDLRNKLKEKFDRYGTVKDEQGNIIDTDIILNNLEKVTYLYTVKKLCLEPGPFSPLAIRKLAEIHARFEDTSMFDTLVLKNQKEMQAEFEKRRQTSNYLNTPHRCESCLKGFLNRAMLDFHVKTSHNPELPFECTICHMRLRTKVRLNNHHCTHKNVLKCKLCDFTSGVRGTMITHVNKHKGVKYTCKHCGKQCINKSSLASHINMVHEARHACAMCAAAFNTAFGLKVHNYKKHPDEEFVFSEENKKCEECNILFITASVYNKHMRKAHLRGRRTGVYRCPTCDWKGASRRSQIQHYQSEHPDGDPTILHNDYNYLCHDCGKRFKSVTAYTAHMNKHTGTRPYSCTKCSKTFFSRIVLYTHMKSHLPPTKECSHCGKKFTTAAGLSNHMMRHLPPTRECPHCGKMFTTGTGLGVHMRIHTNDRRFKCDICGKGFLHSGTLQEHVSGVHYNIRRKRRPRSNDMDMYSD